MYPLFIFTHVEAVQEMWREKRLRYYYHTDMFFHPMIGLSYYKNSEVIHQGQIAK